MMTKQDFVRLATALGLADDLHDAERRIADLCAQSNPAFDRDRFFTAVIATMQAKVDLEKSQ